MLTRQSGEPLAGTAPFAEHFVFITWPKKYWQYEALDSKGGFPDGLKEWMRAQSEISGKISIRLISRKELSNENADIFIYPAKIHYSKIPPEEIQQVLKSHFMQGHVSGYTANIIEKDHILICTHGRHDKCCAKFGQELADKMRYHLKGQEDYIEVWESSHLGGHRFAPTMIDFPTGRAYGQLTPEEIPDYLDNRKQGMVYAPAYRGSVFLSELEQVAEAYAQSFISKKHLNGQVKIRNVEKLTEEKFRCVAEFDSSEKMSVSKNNILDELTLAFKLKGFEGPAGCDDLNLPKVRKCWELESPLSA
ncbi:MAG: hypothetical protein MAG581_00195 [Deltaproteobacteria bacterium]|jgi:hypothetical protein|nr:hypothetical protein [Deltaproteobacteria bacterium]